MNTNAGARDVEWWTKLAQVIGRKGTVIFSVDGLENTNLIYTDKMSRWDFVERNMKAFIAAGGRARWDYLIFEHSECDVERAEQLVKEWGVEKFMKKKTGRHYTEQPQKKKKKKKKNRKGKETTNPAKKKKVEHQISIAPNKRNRKNLW